MLCCVVCYAQDSLVFKPSGKVIVRGFFDYSMGFGHINNESGFDITRAFLGYNYRFTKNIQAQVIIDGASGRSENDRLEVYLRNAFVSWEEDKFIVNVGLIGLLQFKAQEDLWGYRYVLKSYQGLNKMGSSVDLGVTANYKFSKVISADISLLNGEGYKNVRKNNSTRYGMGLTFEPSDHWIFRAYGDIYTDGRDMREELPDESSGLSYKNQYVLALFGGYQNNRIRVGVEYNRQFNNGFIQNKDRFGYSLYSSFQFNPKWNLYARCDWMDSSQPSQIQSGWNAFDGGLMIVVVEFRPSKYFKFSPNLRNVNTMRQKSEQFLFLNLEVNL